MPYPFSLLTSLLLGAGTLPEIPMPALSLSYDRDQQILNVDNPEPGPYTLRIDFPEFENTLVDCERPCLKVAAAGYQGPLLRFRRQDPLRPWRFRYKYRYLIGDYRAQPEKKFVYLPPFAPGAGFTVGQGYHGSFTHKGAHRYALDFIMPEGTPVHAARAGKVVRVVGVFTAGGHEERFKGRDNQVRILHDDGSLAVYKHLRHGGVAVAPGQQLSAGSLLGYSGNTGYSTRPHLHFEVGSNQLGERIESMPTLFRSSSGLTLAKTGQTLTRP